MIKERNLHPDLVGDMMFHGRDSGTARGAMGAATYYVDGNSKNNDNDGLSWDTAMTTLTAGLAAAHAQQGASSNRWWARRSQVYCCGDRLEENLVAMSEKTDVIGVGSLDAMALCGVNGNHVPVNAAAGCRFFNIQFEPAAGSDIWTLDSTSSGTQFIGCNFIGIDGATTAPSGIDSTAHELLRVVGCEFQGGFSSDYIDIGAGIINGTRIIDNIMSGGADNGIMVTGTGTLTSFASRGHIANNFIQCADICIDVNTTSVFNVYNNYMISGEASGASSFVIDLTYACNNRLTSADTFAYIPAEPA